MFCPECGTKNEDAALFCENCGAKLAEQTEVVTENVTNTQPVEPVNATNTETVVAQNVSNTQPVTVAGPTIVERKPLSKKTKLILIGVAVAIVAILVFVKIGKSITDPEKVASKYFEDVAACNWEDVYEYYELSEDDFVNKEMYAKAVKSKKKIEYSNYVVKQSSLEDVEDAVEDLVEGESKKKNNDELYQNIYIQYVSKNSDSTNSTYVVKLYKSKKKTLLFFDTWKVVPEDMLTKQYTIRTLDGIEVTLDGKKVDKKYLKESDSSSEYESNLKIYEIPSMFKGKHTIKFKGAYIDDFEEKVEVLSSNVDSYSYTNPKIKESFIKELETSTQDIIDKLYQGAIADKKFDELELPYEIYEEQKEDIEDRYENICENVDKTSYASSIVLKELKIKEFEITDDNSYIDSGSIAATMSYKMTYKGKFIKDKNGKEEKKEDEDTNSGTVSYKYIDGKWQISRIYVSNIYYYWY